MDGGFMQTYKAMTEQRMGQLMAETLPFPEKIREAMAYSLFAGGKRLRPVLCLAACEAVGGRAEAALDAACALEMIHTYSLIHDDLPGMDNDDLRRGKPTNHKVFGEAMAILAGDGLLTYSFELLADSALAAGDPDKGLLLVKELAAAAGSAGMVGGQVMDILAEDQGADAAMMDYIHRHKTGALITAALRMGGIIGGGSPQALAALTAYGEQIGLAFQIVDDILDVVGDEAQLGKAAGSDAKNHKATFPALYGLEQARNMAESAVQQAQQALAGLPGETGKLAWLAEYTLARNN